MEVALLPIYNQEEKQSDACIYNCALHKSYCYKYHDTTCMHAWCPNFALTLYLFWEVKRRGQEYI